MNTDMQNIESDEISLKELIEKGVVCLSTSQWKIILLAGISCSRFDFLYQNPFIRQLYLCSEMKSLAAVLERIRFS
jgi:hypothetical protein